ncbi:GDSL-type esterase/lipase family protein [Desulfovibrio inopinatus]|uniref:GDSL-type esterase/lipase family protein n=1 Tax=Desulfovibrio inopinatus TaxID=102109 RepID=UPI00040BE376|nr:GDSL-type esterase/lipase family protein [Desulfovibrio inopinatus]
MRICFLGDSITNGIGDPEFLGWPGRLCKREAPSLADLTAYNLGVRADTTALLLERALPEITHRLPDGVDGRVVVSCGVADAFLMGDLPRIPSFDSLANLRQILDQLTPRYPLLVVGPTPVADPRRNAQVAEINSVYANGLAETDIPFCNVYERLGQSAAWQHDLQIGDGVHPKADGYTAMADIIADWKGWRSWF